MIVRGGAVNWRRRLGELAFALGLPPDGDIAGITRKLGPRWAYELRGSICTASQTEWVELLHSLAAQVGFETCTLEVDPVPRWKGENLALVAREAEWDRTLIWADGTIDRPPP